MGAGAARGVRRTNCLHPWAKRTAWLSQGRAASRSCPSPLTSSGTGQRAAVAAALRAEVTHKLHRRQHHPLGTLARWWGLLSCRGMLTRPAEQVVLANAVHLPVPSAVRLHRVHTTVQLTGLAAGRVATSSGTGPKRGVSRCTPGGGPSSRTTRGTAGRLGRARLAMKIALGLRLFAFLRRTMGEPAAWLTARAASSTAAITRCKAAAASSLSCRARRWSGGTACTRAANPAAASAAWFPSQSSAVNPWARASWRVRWLRTQATGTSRASKAQRSASGPFRRCAMLCCRKAVAPLQTYRESDTSRPAPLQRLVQIRAESSALPAVCRPGHSPCAAVTCPAPARVTTAQPARLRMGSVGSSALPSDQALSASIRGAGQTAAARSVAAAARHRASLGTNPVQIVSLQK